MRKLMMAIAGSLLILLGCGGGNTEPEGPMGSVQLTIDWPADSRLLPKAAKSVLVEFKREELDLLPARVLARPPGGGPATYTLKDLLPITYELVLTARPEADGSGVAMSVARAYVRVDSDSPQKVEVIMDSTIDRVEVVGNRSMTTRETIELEGTARDSLNRIVMTDPDSWNWRILFNSAGAEVLFDGDKATVKNAAVGSVVVDARETESGKLTPPFSLVVQFDIIGVWDLTMQGSSQGRVAFFGDGRYVFKDNSDVLHNSTWEWIDTDTISLRSDEFSIEYEVEVQSGTKFVLRGISTQIYTLLSTNPDDL